MTNEATQTQNHTVAEHRVISPYAFHKSKLLSLSLAHANDLFFWAKMKLSITQFLCSLVVALGCILSVQVQADNIVEIAIASNFTTLVTAVVAAGLQETLAGDGNFTVFAPTDAAFAALPDGTVPQLLLEKNLVVLQDILLYHVSPEAVYSSNITDGMMLTMFNGDNVTFTTGNMTNGTMVNDAYIIIADIMADNGVIHVIDSVLLPPEDV
jgi:uncharacterized surface protein with fasciclin (FAS1) repeats